MPLLTAAALLTLAPAAGAIRVPKVTTYQATIDVAGQVVVTAERDTSKDCYPGVDGTIEFEANFELGAPRRTTVTVVDGVVVASQVTARGGAIHKGTIKAYRETNYCPPTAKREIPDPACTRNAGKLLVSLGGSISARTPGDDDPVPLVHPVALSLARVGGGGQEAVCREWLSGGFDTRLYQDYSELSVLQGDPDGLVVPLGASDAAFARLKKGRRIVKVIRFGGACEKAEITFAARLSAARSSSDCTISGSILVTIKRTS